jgi:hypothetical protein
MERGKERRMFPGGNTSEGFFSYYEYIMPQSEAEHMYILKGGPGAGPAFIAAIGERLRQENVDIEYMHNALDPESLVGIALRGPRIALIDGASPHVMDPQSPGAAGETVSLCEYTDAEFLKRHRKELTDIFAEEQRLLGRAYRYLKAAKCMMDDCLSLFGGESMTQALAQAGQITDREFKSVVGTGAGRARNMFASAITPSGVVHYLDTLFDGSYKLYLVISNWGAGVSDMLGKIAEEARIRGLDTEMFYCPMDPRRRTEHLVIPALKLAFVSENRYVDIEARPDAIVDLTVYSDETDREDLKSGESEFDTLLREAVFTLRRAKDTRGEAVSIYAQGTDPEGIAGKRDEIISRILEYIT